MPKLTLNAKKDAIEKAKQIAGELRTSLSALFAQFVETMSVPRGRRRKPGCAEIALSIFECSARAAT